MGFLATELQVILTDRTPDAPWDVLLHMGVHPQQVERLQHAADDFAQVATLPSHALQQLRQELGLSPIEYARLRAGVEADAFFRLMSYHNYPLEEAANKSNAVFASALKDRLATGGKSESVYPAVVIASMGSLPTPPIRRRGRPKRSGSGSAAVALPEGVA